MVLFISYLIFWYIYSDSSSDKVSPNLSWFMECCLFWLLILLQRFVYYYRSTVSFRWFLGVFLQSFKQIKKKYAMIRCVMSIENILITYFPMSCSTFSWPKKLIAWSNSLILPEYLSRTVFALKWFFSRKVVRKLNFFLQKQSLHCGEYNFNFLSSLYLLHFQ